MPTWYAALLVGLLLEMRLPVWLKAIQTWRRRRVYERVYAEFVARYGRGPVGASDVYVLRAMIEAEAKLRGVR